MEKSVKLLNVTYLNMEIPTTVQRSENLTDAVEEEECKKKTDGRPNEKADEKRQIENGTINVRRLNTVRLEREENAKNHVSVKILEDATIPRTEVILPDGFTNHGFSSEYSTSETVSKMVLSWILYALYHTSRSVAFSFPRIHNVFVSFCSFPLLLLFLLCFNL